MILLTHILLPTRYPNYFSEENKQIDFDNEKNGKHVGLSILLTAQRNL